MASIIVLIRVGLAYSYVKVRSYMISSRDSPTISSAGSPGSPEVTRSIIRAVMILRISVSLWAAR